MRKSERTHSLARSPSSGQQIAAAVARDDGKEEGRGGRGRGRGGRDGVARDDGTKGGLKLAATQNSASRSSPDEAGWGSHTPREALAICPFSPFSSGPAFMTK